jgi:hypothetical protein
MKCPKCSAPVVITTTVRIKHHPDESWDVKTPFEFESGDSAECKSCDWVGTYKDLNDSKGATTENRSRQRKVSVLNRATPYPWGRDDRGNLIGANGHAIYFVGADAVLVEYAPVMLENLFSVREQATGNGSQNPGDRLQEIRRLADKLISDIERTDASRGPHAVRRAAGRYLRNTKHPSRAIRTRKR